MTRVLSEVIVKLMRDFEPDDDPMDPSHPDFDLSEAAPYITEARRKPWFLRRWFLILVSSLAIASLVLPYISPV